MDRAIAGREWSVDLLREWQVPEQFHGGLERYLKHGIPPGGFLRAVLENDLRRAVALADSPRTLLALEGLFGFLTNEASGDVWGSRAAVDEWITRGMDARADAARRPVASVAAHDERALAGRGGRR